MPIWWPNSKRCSSPERGRAAALLLSFALALAAPTASSASVDAAASSAVRKQILADLASRRSPSFEGLVAGWERRHGVQAVEPLLAIAAEEKTREDTDRFIALMGAVKLGGAAVVPRLGPFLKDRSWMIRSGGLRAIAALGDARSGASALPLLQDAALVVRAEAVRTVRALRPEGSPDALLSALRDARNYHGGKAQWVPHEALDALVEMRAVGLASALRPLLSHDRDPELQRHAIAALSALTGKRIRPRAPLREQVKAWKSAGP